MNRVSSEISRLRKELGMTAKQLAKQVGVTEKFILEVESGRKVMKDDLVMKVSKILRSEVGKLDLVEGNVNVYKEEPKENVEKVIEKPVQDIWQNAFAGVIASIPVLTIKMEDVVDTKNMLIESNKIEGFAKDKVFYLTIEDNDMSGFKIARNNRVFCVKTKEFEKEGFYLLENMGKRQIRQIKNLGNGKILLVKNDGSLTTNTTFIKDIKILARLIKVEFML